MTRKIQALLAIACSFVLLGTAATAATPYTEGTVSEVAAIRTVDGMFDDYMNWLAGPWKQFMEEQKKAGLIVSYDVYLAYPRTPDDPDLYLVTVYKNMAALDGLEARLEPIVERVMGNRAKANADTVSRGKIRTVLGSQVIRKLDLK